jgi:4-hydroxybenzoate polyprenyltransferase
MKTEGASGEHVRSRVRATLSTRWQDMLAQARPIHWLKNLIVFVPLLTSQQFFNWAMWPSVAGAFVSFCLAASAGYQLNDVIDLKADRQHSQKRTRPLAAGRLSPRVASMLGLGLAAASLMLALAVSLQLALIVLGYVILSALYSTVLKRAAGVDVLALAALYCARIFGGAVAIGVMVSPYLLAFSGFLFLSLALMKRFITFTASEIRMPGYYGHSYGAVMLGSGVATAFLSCGLLGLYVADPEIRARYSSPDLLWGVWLVLSYAMLRGWVRAGRGLLDEDLARAAARDRSLWALGVLAMVVFLTAY